MSGADAAGDGRKPLRLVGYGTAISGVLILLIASISTRPHGIAVFGLGGLAVAFLVFERTQGGVVGLSLGFLTGSIAAWLWPMIGGENYYFLGALLAIVGVVNAVVLLPFYAFGRRLGER